MSSMYICSGVLVQSTLSVHNANSLHKLRRLHGNGGDLEHASTLLCVRVCVFTRLHRSCELLTRSLASQPFRFKEGSGTMMIVYCSRALPDLTKTEVGFYSNSFSTCQELTMNLINAKWSWITLKAHYLGCTKTLFVQTQTNPAIWLDLNIVAQWSKPWYSFATRPKLVVRFVGQCATNRLEWFVPL